MMFKQCSVIFIFQNMLILKEGNNWQGWDVINDDWEITHNGL